MKLRPLGVWFSLVLLVLFCSGWVGWKLGARVAIPWARHQEQKRTSATPVEQARLEPIFSALNATQMLDLYVSSCSETTARKTLLLEGIRVLEDRRRRSDAREISAVLDYHVGIAYAEIATIDGESGKKEDAAENLKSAQALFQSLGWQDYSESALRSFIRQRLHRCTPQDLAKDPRP